MPVFTVTGDVDPFLHVALDKGEAIFCESDAMVMMEANLDLSGTVQGGILQAAMRRFANGESFFQQRIEVCLGYFGEGFVGGGEHGERAWALERIHQTGSGQRGCKRFEITGGYCGVHNVFGLHRERNAHGQYRSNQHLFHQNLHRLIKGFTSAIRLAWVDYMHCRVTI